MAAPPTFNLMAELLLIIIEEGIDNPISISYFLQLRMCRMKKTKDSHIWCWDWQDCWLRHPLCCVRHKCRCRIDPCERSARRGSGCWWWCRTSGWLRVEYPKEKFTDIKENHDMAYNNLLKKQTLEQPLSILLKLVLKLVWLFTTLYPFKS